MTEDQEIDELKNRMKGTGKALNLEGVTPGGTPGNQDYINLDEEHQKVPKVTRKLPHIR